jgi:hypothetical protein
VPARDARVENDNRWRVRVRLGKREDLDVLRGDVFEQLEIAERLRRQVDLVDAVGGGAERVELRARQSNEESKPAVPRTPTSKAGSPAILSLSTGSPITSSATP